MTEQSIKAKQALIQQLRTVAEKETAFLHSYNGYPGTFKLMALKTNLLIFHVVFGKYCLLKII